MCDFCQRRFCPPQCPEYSGEKAGLGKPVGNCEVCKSPIYKGESHFTNGETIVCLECAEYISLEEINLVCGFDGEKELLGALGFYEDMDI